MELKFRQLRADEIDCRVAQIKPNGLTLLLYKDARCDMNILDETVGPMNWQRKHGRDNANCIVSIWDEDKKQWIEKEDTGTESNTEAEKGLASDSFKRACFNWGLGRELYTAPFIWVGSDNCEITTKNGKTVCYDKFAVTDIKYTDGKISDLTIMNTSKNIVAYTMKRSGKKAETSKAEKPKQEPKPEPKPEPPKEQSEEEVNAMFYPTADGMIQNQGGVEYAICSKCGGYIYQVRKKDGSVISVRDMIVLGLRGFNQALCKNCYSEAVKAVRAK